MAQQTCNQFEPTSNTSSATICKWCGFEKFLHNDQLKTTPMNKQTASASEWIKVFEQAKQMEKEQIVKAFNEGTFSLDEKIQSEQYYKETYKTGEQ